MKLLSTIKRRTWTTEYYQQNDMCVIKFTRDDGLKLESFIDIIDYPWVSLLPIYPALTRGYYIMYSERDPSGVLHNKYLHKTMLSDAVMMTDHINRNSLDNRRSNLRLVTCSENLRNGSMHRTNQVGRKGLCWRKNASGEIVGVRANVTTDRGQKEKQFLSSVYGSIEIALQNANMWLNSVEIQHGVSSSWETNEEKLKIKY